MSAGLGTRMGSIGKVLPKPLWPIFETNLLELQIIYAKKLGAKNLFINSHHLHSQLENEIQGLQEKYSNVHLIHEKELLGSGGGVHNFCRHPLVRYQGNAIYLSGDQFLFFEDNELQNIKTVFEEKKSCLVGITVQGSGGYNQVICQNNELTEIKKNPQSDSNYNTFSGMCFLKLNELERSTGVSSFFDTVLNFKTRKVGIYNLKKQEYWDFGTVNRYANSCFRLLERQVQKNSKFFEIFSKSLVINEVFYNPEGQSYSSTFGRRVLNFSKKKMDLEHGKENMIFLSETTMSLKSGYIYFENVSDQFSFDQDL
jgi:mannose-1-phosphate guanylyltransferase